MKLAFFDFQPFTWELKKSYLTSKKNLIKKYPKVLDE